MILEHLKVLFFHKKGINQGKNFLKDRMNGKGE